ncbi:hypothetical protein FBY06_11820 [Pseudomonas sp. SJZ085]|uniref:hypothetical protein n=1 Tax=unclassified Pseudomonas TaxID=196821 RepID=UPI00119B1A29|nr:MULTISPECIES: hypothetical protein [unclassified Pseudomonas]TWC17132.1 hypothetical protein FBX99_118124 [Pseudomonas sp. SJZ074]TWC35114.1 hypothetical protein FBY06_11820 [Pseudomonas sp. SJZ085]
MNAVLNICQAMHDAKLPPPVSETQEEVARAEWLYNAAEDLLRGQDVKFQRRMRQPQGVTVAELALAVDEHVNGRLADCEVHTPALGWLLLSPGRPDKNAIAELLGPSDHPLGKLGEIAEDLLRPLVDDALIAQAEDDEL